MAEPVLQVTDNEARVTQFWIGVGGGRLNRALKGRLGYSRVLKDSAMVLPPFAAASLPIAVAKPSLYYLPSSTVQRRCPNEEDACGFHAGSCCCPC